jgi:hypothetical protein
MAKFIPVEGRIHRLETPLTLTALKALVGDDVELVTTRTDDIVVVRKDSWGKEPINPTASSLAGLKSPIYGNAVFCTQDDIA